MNTIIETMKLKRSDILYMSKKSRQIFDTTDDSLAEALKKMFGMRNLTALHESEQANGELL